MVGPGEQGKRPGGPERVVAAVHRADPADAARMELQGEQFGVEAVVADIESTNTAPVTTTPTDDESVNF